MPRAFSSGALSIESNDRNWILGLCFCSTFVMSAVRVVLPWSTCPIVPMFTCGLLRSNFSLLIVVLLCLASTTGGSPPLNDFMKMAGPVPPPTKLLTCYALHLRDYFLRNVLGRLVIALEMHCRSRASLRRRTQVGRIAEHF